MALHSPNAEGQPGRPDVVHCNARPHALALFIVSAVACATTLAFVPAMGNVSLVFVQGLALVGCLGAIASLLHERSRNAARIKNLLAEGELQAPAPDDAVDDRRWLAPVEGCVSVLDALEQHRGEFAPGASALAAHVNLRLPEILERSAVGTIAGETSFDRHRLQPEIGGANACSGTTVSATLRPGLAIGRCVVRRGVVRLERDGTANGPMSARDAFPASRDRHERREVSIRAVGA